MLHTVRLTLDAMGVEQYLLAFLFLACYTLTLGQFVGARGRGWALAGAATACIEFAARCDAWQDGVLVVAVALVALGGFGAAVWVLWALFGWPEGGHGSPAGPVAEDLAPAPPHGWPGPRIAAWRPAGARLAKARGRQ